jgi:membrane protease YdiL (CAAX protease family)
MRNDGRGDVLKLWLYAAGSLVLGAWIAPLLYNAGKALAEISSGKTTNGLLEWLATRCRAADFPRFYEAGLLLAAALLFLPWVEWLHTRRGPGPDADSGPWLLRVPGKSRLPAAGQPLRKNLRGLWHGCAGFLLVAGLLLPMGVALAPAGLGTLRYPAGGVGTLSLSILPGAVILAAVMEVFFRGIAMGIFLRAMRPAAALGMSAAFFALVVSAFPPPGFQLPDPEAARAGFGLLGMLVARFADWAVICENFAPLLALGGVLAYARWRTASLWLPVGLHAGWLFAKRILAVLAGSAVTDPAPSIGRLLEHGMIPLAAILLAGVLAHYLTIGHADEPGRTADT